MNRNDEYNKLMEELDAACPSVCDGTLDRAVKRNRRRQRIVHPVVSIAAVFVCFVAMVNLSQPVALACAKVPVLRELAQAVSFSRSLTDAVDNDYGQTIDLTQTDGDVTATVEYLIVDQKHVTVFYRLDSEKYNNLYVDIDFLEANGEDRLGSCVFGVNDFGVPNGQLQSATIDFIDRDVPESMHMYLNIWDETQRQQTATEAVLGGAENVSVEDTREYVAKFDFLLEYDPLFTRVGKHIEINQTVELDGQRIYLTDMEVYPSGLRLNVDAASDNTAWLTSLSFYIETDKGERFDAVSNGVTATGSGDTPMMNSYRADSTYFYEASKLKIVITGAKWLDKDMEKIHVDLASATAEIMPDDTELAGVERLENGWQVAVRAKWEIENSFRQIFLNTYYDAAGNVYGITSWKSVLCYGDYPESDDCFYEVFPLEDYPYDEVWLTPAYSHFWTAKEPVSITVNVP